MRYYSKLIELSLFSNRIARKDNGIFPSEVSNYQALSTHKQCFLTQGPPLMSANQVVNVNEIKIY
jgi:hypothetical protein